VPFTGEEAEGEEMLSTPIPTKMELEAKKNVGVLLGSMKNLWRRRNVQVFTHKADKTKVVTVGTSIDNPDVQFWCVEDLCDWSAALIKMQDSFENGRVYTYE
jgi:hypothetical protein